MNNGCLQAALEYLERGFSIIPVSPFIDPGTKKATKRPIIQWKEFQVRTPTANEITEWWQNYKKAMVGIVTGKVSNLLVIDCDNEEAFKLVESYLPESFVTPIARSPRGGWHYYFKMPSIALTVAVGIVKGLDFRAEGGYIVAPPSTIDNGKGYSWQVGLDYAIQDLPEKLITFLKDGTRNAILGSSTSISRENLGVYSGNNPLNTTNYYTDNILLQEGHRDQDLFHIANCLVKGGCEKNAISQVLKILAQNCNPPFSEKEVEAKIKSALERGARKERNLADEVREFFLLQEGYTNTTDILQTLQITTREEKKNLTVILSRLQAEGIIEKYGEKRGCYRPVTKKPGEMKFIETDFFEYPVKMPFGLNDLCRLYPQNIVVVAGTKSSGKTAFLMDIAFRNQDRAEVVYLNSEMGDEEWSDRIKKRGITKASDIKFRSYACHKNFHDMIENGSKRIYIVDYLEIHDNFFEVAKPIRQIHEKLHESICFVGIQKKGNQPLGRGAEFSMEKSRLYLAFDYLEAERCSKLTIVDAKAPKFSEGVRGFWKRIKILDGVKMEAMDREWLR